jgi:tetratricopeptide (TPR) repeat protein
LREAVRLTPRNAKAHAGLGLTEALLGNREAGLRHGLQARALAPANADVLASLGALYLHLGEPARASPELTESLRIRPNQVHAALNRALALARLGQQDAAEAQLERALALVRLMSPELPLADRITAEVAAGRDPARAAAAWERYLARLQATNQLTPPLVEELGRAKQRLGEGVVAPPGRRLRECEDDHRGGSGGDQVERGLTPWTAAQRARCR